MDSEMKNDVLDAMKLFDGLFHRVIHPVLLIFLSVPLHNCFCFPCTREARTLKKGSGLSLSKSSLFNAIPNVPAESVFLKEVKGLLGSDRLNIAPKYPLLLRKAIEEICREMSPREAFEFRLRSRISYCYVPHGIGTPPVRGEHGLVYNITDADWFSPDGEEIRNWIEDDDRYTVDWGDLENDSARSVIVFMPRGSISNERHESVFLKEVKGLLGSDRLNIAPKYPLLLRKAIEEICREMSPQEAFEFRLRSRISYCYVPHGISTPPVRGEQGLVYNITDADWLSPDGEEIRNWIEDDDRYTVDWDDLENSKGRNVIVFMPRGSIANERHESDVSSSTENPQLRQPDRSRLVIRILSSLPQLALHTVMIIYGILLNLAPVLYPLLFSDTISDVITTLSDFAAFCVISFYVSSFGFALWSMEISEFLKKIDDLKKGPED